MELILELNQRYGYGYQAHLIMPPVDSILDVEPFTLYDAANGAKTVVDEINKATGSNYKLHEVLCITDEALRANKERDLASAKLWKEKRSGDHSSIAPSQEPMTRTMIIDGKEEVMLSARGLMLFSFYAWRDDRKPKVSERILPTACYAKIWRYSFRNL